MNYISQIKCTLVVLLCGFALLIYSSNISVAGSNIRFAYLKTISLLPFIYGEQKGYFKAEGIDLDMIAVPGGPAVGAAIASGSADIGYAAPPPVANAREQGQPFKFFMSLEYERTPDRLWGYMLASEKSGLKSIGDLSGRTIVVGPPGGLCELATRDWLKKARIDVSNVKFLNNPFPQMPAMLEVGTADAACMADPYASAAINSKAKAVTLTRGFLAEVPIRYRIEGLFAKEDWIASHKPEIAALKRAFLRATDDLRKDPSIARAILAEEYRFPLALANSLKLYDVTDVDTVASEYQPVLDKMIEHQMLSKPMMADDLVTNSK